MRPARIHIRVNAQVEAGKQPVQMWEVVERVVIRLANERSAREGFRCKGPPAERLLDAISPVLVDNIDWKYVVR